MKRSNKKALSVLVALCVMCLSMMSVAFADDTTSSLVAEAVVVDSSTATLTLSLPEGTGICGGSIKITYDTTKIEVASYDRGDIKPTLNVGEGKVNVSFADVEEVSGEFVTVTFTLLDGTFDASYLTFTECSFSQDGVSTIESLDTVTPVINVTDNTVSDEPATEGTEATEATEATDSISDNDTVSDNNTEATDATDGTTDGDNNASDTGDANYFVVVLFAMVALVGCVAAKKKAIF